MSADKYPSIFSRQIEAIVFIFLRRMEAIVFIILQRFLAMYIVFKIGQYLLDIPQFQLGCI